MPVPPKQLKTIVEDDVDSHAFQHWPQLGEVTVRWHGSCGYPIGHWDDDEDDDGFPLARIEYLGDPQEWAFAIYQASSDTYPNSVPLQIATRWGSRYNTAGKTIWAELSFAKAAGGAHPDAAG